MAVTCGAHAADKPVYAPPGAWVKPLPIPAAPANADGAATQILMENLQTRFGLAGDEAFQELAVRVVTSQGLEQVGNFILPWDPSTETLTIHRLNILRDGKVIDLLNGGKDVTILRRENNLESATLDGSLTATIQPAGLEVGDIIDLAYTQLRHDPVMQDHSVGFLALTRPGLVGRAYFRAEWLKSKPIQWKVTEGLPQPVITSTADGQEAVIDRKDVRAPKPPAGAPSRFADLANISFSQFKDWPEVSAMMQPLFAKASQLKADSPLKAQIAAIAVASPDPKIRAGAALKLVEEKTRYVALLLNNGGYIPADADATWTRRYGDCKAKTALLLALLHGLGIEAEPVLVNAGGSDGLDQQLPMVMFNHVVVRATIGGRSYWLDGTRQGDPGLDNLTVPNYDWVLPLTTKGSTIERVVPPAYDKPRFESRVRLDARAGLDGPAPAHVEHIFRGDEGLGMHLVVSQGARTDVDLAMRQYWREKISWIDPKVVSFIYDDATTTLTLVMDGTASMQWSQRAPNGERDFFAYDTTLGFQANFDREPGPHQDAPYAVAYPRYTKATVSVQLPAKGADFALMDTDQDKTLGGVRYLRRSRQDADGVVVIEASEQAVQPEFSAAEAKTAAAALNQLALYSGGIQQGGKQDALQHCVDSQNYTDAAATCTALITGGKLTGSDLAEAYAVRGSLDFRAGQFDAAVKDTSQAITFDPRNGLYLAARGQAYAGLGMNDLALADFDHALAAKPELVSGWGARGALQLRKGALDKAIADFGQAIRLNPSFEFAYQNRAEALARNGKMDAAIEDASRVVELDPANTAAWIVRANFYMSEHRLDKATSDIAAAARLSPKSSGVVYARATLEMIQADYDASIKDYDEVDRLSPGKTGASLQRSIIYRRQGRFDLALQQINHAIAMQPNNATAYSRRAEVFELQHQWDKAISDRDQASKLAPNQAGTLNGQCWTRAMANQDLDVALGFCDAGIKLAPNNADIFDSRGLAHFRKGQLKEAAADYDQALKLKAKEPSSLFMRGVIKRRQGDAVGGGTDIEAAKTLDAKVLQTYADLGVAP